jgi:hypothetical protein
LPLNLWPHVGEHAVTLSGRRSSVEPPLVLLASGLPGHLQAVCDLRPADANHEPNSQPEPMIDVTDAQQAPITFGDGVKML